MPRRLRSWLLLVLLGLLLSIGLGPGFSAVNPGIQPSSEPTVPAIDWGEAAPTPHEQELPALRVGSYITNFSNIDLLDDQFSIELLLWTLWQGDPDRNPSDQLRILNGIYDGDVQRFELVRRDVVDGASWSLYKVRSAVVKRWRLQRYPFDDQLLRVQVGLDDPLQPVNLDVVPEDPLTVAPSLLLPGWDLKEPKAYASTVTLMNDLGHPKAPGVAVRRQPTVSMDVPIQRRSLLFVAPDFLGYMLAVGLCCMSLLITRSRDDLILAAVVSAGGNYVFIAGQLPVTAMTGFIGSLQLIIFLGILYVVAADELIDHQLSNFSERFAQWLRVLLLPSYVGMTLFGIWWIIP